MLTNFFYFFSIFLSACSGHLEKKNDRTIKGDIGGACAKRSDKVDICFCLQMIQSCKIIFYKLCLPYMKVAMTIHIHTKTLHFTTC